MSWLYNHIFIFLMKMRFIWWKKLILIRAGAAPVMKGSVNYFLDLNIHDTVSCLIWHQNHYKCILLACLASSIWQLFQNRTQNVKHSFILQMLTLSWINSFQVSVCMTPTFTSLIWLFRPHFPRLDKKLPGHGQAKPRLLNPEFVPYNT